MVDIDHALEAAKEIVAILNRLPYNAADQHKVLALAEALLAVTQPDQP